MNEILGTVGDGLPVPPTQEEINAYLERKWRPAISEAMALESEETMMKMMRKRIDAARREASHAGDDK